MDKDLLFDDILKEKANNEKLVLPEKLDLKIKDTLNNLPERSNKKGKFIKKVGIAAAITLACGVGVSISFPAFARNLPVVSSVFQYLSEKNIIDKDYVRYSADLNMSKSYNGITVTINSIVYDGIDLSIGYTVESQNEIKETPVIIGPNMKINGKTVGFGGGGGGEFKDKKTYIGVRTVNMAKDYLPKEVTKHIVGGNVKIPDEFIMDFNIRDLSQNMKGKWDFKFKVSTEKIKSNVKSIKTNIDLSAVRPGLKVNEVIISPINTVLRTVEKSSEGLVLDGMYIVFDDKGRPLEMKSGSGNGSAEVDTFYTQLLFRNVYEDSKTLTFIPYMDSKEILKGRNDEVENWRKKNNGRMDGFRSTYKPVTKEVSLNLNGTTILQEGKLGDYKVTKIEFLQNKTLIHYECTKLLPMMFPYEISLIDSSGKVYELNKTMVKEIDSVAHKYIGELPAMNKDMKYKLKSRDFEKLYEVREDAKFTIQIK